MKKVWFGVLAAGVATGVACSTTTGNGNGCGMSAPVTVTASDAHTFSPQTVTIAVGQAVCFQNLGTQLHTITPDSQFPGDSAWADHGFQSLPPNLPTIISFGAGDFYYHCQYHGSPFGNDPTKQMWGVIHVR